MGTKKPVVMREKRQLTLPVELCEKLHLVPGQAFDWSEQNGRIVLEPAELRRREPRRTRATAVLRPTKAQLEERKRLKLKPITDEDLEALERDAVRVKGEPLTEAEIDAAIREGRDE